MDVKISVFNKQGEEKNQLIVEMKQVSVNHAPAIIESAMNNWKRQFDCSEPVLFDPFVSATSTENVQLDQSLGTFLHESTNFLNPQQSVRIGGKETENLLQAVKETAEISNYPDIEVKLEVLEEKTPGTVLVEGVTHALHDPRFIKRSKPRPTIHIPKVLTRKVVEQEPVHKLRKIVAHTPWLHILQYSKMPAPKLRKAMLRGIEEYNNRTEAGEKDIQVVIDDKKA